MRGGGDGEIKSGRDKNSHRNDLERLKKNKICSVIQVLENHSPFHNGLFALSPNTR